MKQPPNEIHGVKQSQFSVARYYGGCRFMGAYYHYDPVSDILIRNDIYQARRKAGKLAAKAAKAERAKWMQGELLK